MDEHERFEARLEVWTDRMFGGFTNARGINMALQLETTCLDRALGEMSIQRALGNNPELTRDPAGWMVWREV